MVGVLYVGDGNCGIAHPVVHNRIHRDGHAVFCQNLKVMIKPIVTVISRVLKKSKSQDLLNHRYPVKIQSVGR